MTKDVFELRLNDHRLLETLSYNDVRHFFDQQLKERKKSDTLTILRNGQRIISLGPAMPTHYGA